MFAGVVAAVPGGVVAVITDQHQEVLGAERCAECRKATVEGVERPRVTDRVTTVPVDGVKADEVGEDEAIDAAVECLDGALYPVGIILAGNRSADAPLREDVGNLADADDLPSDSQKRVEHGIARGEGGVVVTIGVATAIVAPFPIEGTGDHARNLVLPGKEGARRTAPVVEGLERHHIDVRSDLEDAVGTGVNDRLAGALVLGSELIEDGGPRGGTIAEMAPAGVAVKGGHQRIGEAFKGLEGGIEDDAHQFPVAAGGVLRAALLAHTPESARGAVVGGERGHPRNHPEAELGEMRQRYRATREGVIEGMATGITAWVRGGDTELRGIGERPDANRIKHDNSHAAATTHATRLHPSPQRGMMTTVALEAGGDRRAGDLARLVWAQALALAPKAEHWAVGVSGGGDSIALAHMLHACGARISMLHVDHGLREESGEDARYVENLAATWGVGFASEAVGVRAAMGRSGNVEAVARKLRRVALHRLARAVGADVLLLAHTLDDQAETVILQALRGAATLRGMPERQGRMLRPLLSVSRNELRAYLDHQQQPWREDPSNHDLERARAWVRHAVLPRLEAYAPGAAHRLARLALQQQALADFVRHEAERRIPGVAALVRSPRPFMEGAEDPGVDAFAARAAAEGIEVHNLRQQPLAVQREALAALLRAAGVEVDLQRVERVRERLLQPDAAPWRASVGAQRWWRLAYGRVGVVASEEEGTAPRARPIRRAEELPAAVDPLVLGGGPLVLRTRRAGDVVALPGGHRSLADVLIDAKVPREERDRLPLLARGEEVVWAEDVIDATPLGPRLRLDPEEGWMRAALAEARLAAEADELPVGAVVVRGGAIIARAHNRTRRDADPTAHAEVLAIRAAAAALGDWRLSGATLVVTLEPCPMCFGALLAAHIGRLVFGAVNPREGAVGGVAYLPGERWKRTLSVRPGVRAAEASELLRSFFAERRTA